MMYTHSLGSPDNPALVFLHGFMGSGEDWIQICEYLKQDFFCLLPDLPGHGSTPLDSNPGYESWSTELQEILLAQGVSRFCLIGYSLGGRLALYFSLTFPEMVSHLVLESANPGLGNTQTRNQRAARDTRMAARILQDGLEPFLNKWYDLPLFESLNCHPDLKAELRRQRAQQSPQHMAVVLQALSPGRQVNLSDRLAEIQMPTLLIAGRLDQKYANIIRSMSQVIPNSHMLLLDECGHNVHRECTARYVKQLRHWLMKTYHKESQE